MGLRNFFLAAVCQMAGLKKVEHQIRQLKISAEVRLAEIEAAPIAERGPLSQKLSADFSANIHDLTKILDRVRQRGDWLIKSAAVAARLGAYVTVFIWLPVLILLRLLRAIGRSGVSRQTLHRPPGYLALKLLLIIFPKRAFDMIFSQTFLDMQEEYLEALSLGLEGTARWIVVRGHLALLLSAFAYLAALFAKKFSVIFRMLG